MDASGNVATTYSFDPFGNTTLAGATNTNAFQYTGRENEGNGLYFYRARYYSSVLGRFVNEDPAGEGQNFYTYADDDPIDFSDPLGLWPLGNTVPANIPSSGTNGGLQLIQGGAGAGRFLPRGAGQWGLAGFLFVLDAGLAYEDYQAIQTFTRRTRRMMKSGNQSPHTIRRCWPIRDRCRWRADTRARSGDSLNMKEPAIPVTQQWRKAAIGARISHG